MRDESTPRKSKFKPAHKSISLWCLLVAITACGWLFALYFAIKLANTSPPPAANSIASIFSLWQSPSATPSSSMEYKDFISILLTAIGVLIAALALILALAAVWGFSGMKEILIAAARDQARETATDVARSVSGTASARTAATMSEAGWDEPARNVQDDYGSAAGKEDGNGAE